ncbi:hypothetical protein VYU27_000457 [Nannochloropsis oceanica]
MDDTGATISGPGGNESGSTSEAHAAAKAASGGAKELTKEQLLGYIKKLKHKVKEVETELQQIKTQHAALQVDHTELEGRAAALTKKDRETDNRLIQAAEDVHRAEADGKSRVNASQTRVDELDRGLEESRRAKDGQIELAERAKRAEGELQRAQDRIATLETDLAASLASASSTAAAKVEASTPSTFTNEVGEMARLQAENEEMNGKLKMLIERYKALQTKAKSVVEEKAGLAQELEAARAATAAAVAATTEVATGVQQQLERAKEELVHVRAERDGLTTELASLRVAATAGPGVLQHEQQEQYQQLLKELEQVRRERDALTVELKSLRATAAEATVAAQEQHVEGQQQELLQLKKERESLAAQLASWRSEAEAAQAAYAASQAQHELAFAALQNEQETLQGKIAALSQQPEEEIETIGREDNDNKKGLEKEVKLWQGEVASLKEQPKEGSQAQTAQVELERALACLQEERDMLRGNVAEITERLVEADAAKAVLMEEAQKSVDTHHQEVQRLQRELDAATAAATAERERSLDSSHDNGAAVVEALAVSQKEVVSLQLQLEAQQTKVNELQLKVAAAKTERETVRAQLAAELRNAEQQVRKAEGEVAAVEGQKKEQEEMVKRLKTLLAKSRSVIQLRDQELGKIKAAAEAEAVAPSSFTVTLRVRAGQGGKEAGGKEGKEDGMIWCHVVLPLPPVPAAPAAMQDELSVSSSTSEPPTLPQQQQEQQRPSTLWIKEETVREWTKQALANAPGSVASVSCWPAVLQETWVSKEEGLTHALEEERKAKQLLEAEFDKYRARAHAALKKATERSGEDKHRDRYVEEENARLIEEREQWEAVARELEDKIKELEVVVQELREEQEERMKAAERGWKKAVEEEERRGMILLGEAEAKADMRWKETVAEWSKKMEASEREGDALEEKIIELEGQLKAAQAAAVAADNAAKAASAAAAMAKATATAQARDEAAAAAAAAATFTAGRVTGKFLSFEQQRGEGGEGGGNRQVDDDGRYDPVQRSTNQRTGHSVTPLDIPPPPLSSSSSAGGGGFGSTSGSGVGGGGGGGRDGEGDLASLGDQYVVIKQLTADFQSERLRDLQLIAQMQEEMSEMNATQAKLQEQERVLKVALRTAEESLARERELHAGPVNVEYLKHAIYGFLTAHNDKERLTLLSVIVTMLHFSPEEASKARAATQGGEGVVGGVKGWISSKLGGGGGGGGGGGMVRDGGPV